MGRSSCSLAVVIALAAWSGLARADADMAIVVAAGADVLPSEIVDMVRAERPGRPVVAARPSEQVWARRRLVVQSGPGGLLQLVYSDAQGRRLSWLLDPGRQASAAVASVAIDLLDGVDPAAPEEPSLPEDEDEPPVVEPALVVPRLRPPGAVRQVPASERTPWLFGRVALGVAARNLEVEVLGSPSPRTFEAAPFPTVAFEVSAFPLRAAGVAGVPSWLGVSARIARDLGITVTGITELDEEIDIDTSFHEEQVLLVLDVPIPSTPRPDPPRLRTAVGYGALTFWFDPVQMSLLQTERQVPTFSYTGLLTSFEADAPLGHSGVRLGGGVSYHLVTDVGQAARDLFGDRTKGSDGLGLHAWLSAHLVPRLEGSLTSSFRRYRTELHGTPLDGTGPIDGFPRGDDDYLDLFLGLSYLVP